jgi:hypothetical protein
VAFELVTIQRKGFEGLRPGQAAIDRRGSATLHVSDCTAAGITDAVALLADPSELRLGFRKPGEGDQAGVVRAAPIVNKRGDLKRRRITVNSALNALCIDAKTIAGHYTVEQQDGMLVLDLASATEEDRKRADGTARPAGKKTTRGGPASRNAGGNRHGTGAGE